MPCLITVSIKNRRFKFDKLRFHQKLYMEMRRNFFSMFRNKKSGIQLNGQHFSEGYSVDISRHFTTFRPTCSCQVRGLGGSSWKLSLCYDRRFPDSYPKRDIIQLSNDGMFHDTNKIQRFLGYPHFPSWKAP